MSYLDRVKMCHAVDHDNYLPFIVDGEQYGNSSKGFVSYLKQWSDVFQVTDESVTLNPNLSDYNARSAAVAPIIEALHQQGVIDSWVDEMYPINHQFGQRGVMQIERAASHYFGIRSYGVHINGLVKKSDGSTHVWVATRAKDKPFFPGRLDQIVAGGQPVGISLLENVVKESQEEADIPEFLASQAQARGYVNYSMDTKRGMDTSTLYNFDCWLPEEFTPKNTDGEVDSFELMSIEQVAEITDQTEDFKDNCNLTNIDLLVRSGVITDKHPDYAEITRLLYSA